MRSYLILGAAALAFASPAPQGFEAPADAVLEGPPVGVGPASDTGYTQSAAQNAAATEVNAVATAQQAKRTVAAENDLEARWFWNLKNKGNNYPAPTPTPPPAPVPTPPPSTKTGATTSPNYDVPSTCTPVSWTNTWAFTADPACATAIEVGTYCGFVNPLDPCAPQPIASGPDTKPDTVDAFKNNQVYQQMALKAQTPSTYDQAFVNLNGAVTGNGYLTYKTLGSYDVAGCAKFCDETSTCLGFNVFIERDPKWNPDQCSCTGDDVPSIANYKCSLWGQAVSKDSATNTGQGLSGFDVIIVASNGYNKKTYTPPTPPNTGNPQDCGKKLHNQQPYCMGQKTFPGPWDPSVCAAYAQKQNDVNRKSGIIAKLLSFLGLSKGGCVQFQAAYLEKDGKGFGTHCRLFTKKFQPKQATLDVSVGAGSKWSCFKSFTWDVDVNASFNWGGWSWKN
ncbi:hypothetical protein BS50DRAFT_561664 [Corynespora cassiicola Philippines]|uniref:Apple domain-containing protein n=1 Tax=Corynespora cassiicola Philippines TaxID=1448308 RepID=A0A2T2N855_CORCC|nr:hypothetical protein BS50DRAFT_561664 [Corynespora cassiicola Philippines]